MCGVSRPFDADADQLEVDRAGRRAAPGHPELEICRSGMTAELGPFGPRPSRRTSGATQAVSLRDATCCGGSLRLQPLSPQVKSVSPCLRSAIIPHLLTQFVSPISSGAMGNDNQASEGSRE